MYKVSLNILPFLITSMKTRMIANLLSAFHTANQMANRKHIQCCHLPSLWSRWDLSVSPIFTCWKAGWSPGHSVELVEGLRGEATGRDWAVTAWHWEWHCWASKLFQKSVPKLPVSPLNPCLSHMRLTFVILWWGCSLHSALCYLYF